MVRRPSSASDPATSQLFEQPVRVLELGTSIAGSYCGLMLGRLGASVRTVEPPGGSPLRSLPPLVDTGAPDKISTTYAALTLGKEVIEADLDDPAGVEHVTGLLGDAPDVVVMSGRLEEWHVRGLGPERVLELSPASIVARVTLFGDDGPYARMAGGELQAQALGGLLNMVGEPDREPLRLGGFQAQYSAGLALVTGTAIALFRRRSTGAGEILCTSVIETVAHVEWKTPVTFQSDGAPTVRGSEGAPAILRAADGHVAFYYRAGDWPAVVELVGDPRLHSERFATPRSRAEHRPELVSVLEDFTRAVSKRDLYHRAQALGITVGYAATMSDLLRSPHYLARGFLESVTVGGRAGLVPGAPWRARTAPWPQAPGETA